MSKRQSGCYRIRDGIEEPVDQIRFAVGSEAEGLLSTEWMATRAFGNSRDLFLATKGLARDVKVTFHDDDVIIGFLAESAPKLRARGLLQEGESRQRSIVPVQSGTWIAAYIDFLAGALRTPDRGLPIRKGKAISLIPPPPRGHLTRVLVAHSDGEVPVVRVDDHILQPFARIENGHRHLAFYTVVHAMDEEAEEQKLRALVEQIPGTPEALETADAGNLAAVMWGDEDGHLNIIELHNLRRANPKEE